MPVSAANNYAIWVWAGAEVESSDGGVSYARLEVKVANIVVSLVSDSSPARPVKAAGSSIVTPPRIRDFA